MQRRAVARRRERRDDAALDDAHEAVSRVCDEHAVPGVDGDAARQRQRRRRRGPSVSEGHAVAAARERGDAAGRRRDDAHEAAARIGDVQVAGAVEREAHGRLEVRGGRGAAVTTGRSVVEQRSRRAIPLIRGDRAAADDGRDRAVGIDAAHTRVARVGDVRRATAGDDALWATQRGRRCRATVAAAAPHALGDGAGRAAGAAGERRDRHRVSTRCGEREQRDGASADARVHGTSSTTKARRGDLSRGGDTWHGLRRMVSAGGAGSQRTLRSVVVGPRAERMQRPLVPLPRRDLRRDGARLRQHLLTCMISAQESTETRGKSDTRPCGLLLETPRAGSASNTEDIRATTSPTY